MTGPLSQEALAAFAAHLSELAGRRMILDPDAYGHEVFDENRARYQFKVEGGRSSDDQGVCLKATGDPEVWIIRHNLVWVGFHIRPGRRGPDADAILRRLKSAPTLEELARNDPGSLLPHSFLAVVAEFMEPYEGLL